MFHKRIAGFEDETGFSLIELLVVILIIGIIAAIALPAFLNQRGKAYDTAAKSNIKTAAFAEETYETDHGGTYASDTITASDTTGALASVEPRLENVPFVTATANGNVGFTLVATSDAAGGTAETFTYVASDGTVTKTCTPSAGGCVNSTW